LATLWIPPSVRTIGPGTFNDCDALSTVLFGRESQLSWIQRGAFWNCHGLFSISLPSGLERLETVALDWQTLKHIEIDPANPHLRISGSSIVDFEGVSLVAHLGLVKSSCIGNNIVNLGEGCFAWQRDLLAVSFEAGSRIRQFGDEAFHATGLKSIVIPWTVEIIGKLCFGDCQALSDVRFEPNSRLSVIGERAFTVCRALRAIWIPARLQSLFVEHLWYVDGPSVSVLKIIEPGSSPQSGCILL
jgi:hypothetical protein